MVYDDDDKENKIKFDKINPCPKIWYKEIIK
jgi:hypothetical protein